MKYEDFPEILRDSSPLMDTPFGPKNQLQVLGWAGKSGGHKLYIVKCSVCALDGELFGDGVFSSLKCNILRGQTPCGCAKFVRYTEAQYRTLCKRAANDLNCVFIGWVGEYKKIETRVKVECIEHGVWSTGSIHSLVLNGSGCPQCRTEALRSSRLKPDEDMIKSFFASGVFHPDTKFWRSPRKTKQNRAIYWNVYCPDCDSVAETQSDSLQSGCKSCECSRYSQKEAYVNIIYDGDFPLALKFGISNLSSNRLTSQNRSSVYRIENHSTFKFEDVFSCKKAERDCKDVLICGVVDKCAMLDGWSETTYTNNLEEIENIYLSNGGVRVI